MTTSVTEIHFAPASAELQRRGQLGWCSCVVDSKWHFSNISVRRTLPGRRAVSFPARIVDGVQLHHVWPVDGAVRDEIERVLLAHVAQDGRVR